LFAARRRSMMVGTVGVRAIGPFTSSGGTAMKHPAAAAGAPVIDNQNAQAAGPCRPALAEAC
jgi:hypothetical protein